MFDTKLYDIDNSKELRIILDNIKNKLYIGEYAVEWNTLFFTAVRYAFAEQQYIDWAFKTSFLNATHNVGSLEQKLNYKNDNLSNFTVIPNVLALESPSIAIADASLVLFPPASVMVGVCV